MANAVGNELVQATGVAANKSLSGTSEFLTTSQIAGVAFAPGQGVMPVANGGTGTTVGGGFPNVLNFVPGVNMVNWRKALANMRNGVSDARILCVGDSTTLGYGTTLGSTFPTRGAYPKVLANELAARGFPAAEGLGCPPSAVASNPDGRWTGTLTGWGLLNGFGAGSAADYTNSTSTVGTLIYTPSVNCDSFYIYSLTNNLPNLSNILATATGGSQISVNGAAAPSTIRSTVASAASASTSNTLTMTASALLGVHCVGVEPFLSTTKQILVGNAGVGGTTTVNWTGGASQTWNGLALINANAPDLTIISLGANDAGTAVSSATYLANIQSLITAAKVSGDVLLLPSIPAYENGGSASYLAQYYTGLVALAALNNVPMADVFNYFNQANNGTPFGAGDNVHFNNVGYATEAHWLCNLILGA